jgi:hypothetical protein
MSALYCIARLLSVSMGNFRRPGDELLGTFLHCMGWGVSRL